MEAKAVFFFSTFKIIIFRTYNDRESSVIKAASKYYSYIDKQGHESFLTATFLTPLDPAARPSRRINTFSSAAILDGKFVGQSSACSEGGLRHSTFVCLCGSLHSSQCRIVAVIHSRVVQSYPMLIARELQRPGFMATARDFYPSLAIT